MGFVDVEALDGVQEGIPVASPNGETGPIPAVHLPDRVELASLAGIRRTLLRERARAKEQRLDTSRFDRLLGLVRERTAGRISAEQFWAGVGDDD